jgi:putative endonuclease
VDAIDSVDRRKQLKLSRAAGIFLHRHSRLGAGPCRFDVVAFDAAGAPNWIRNAFESQMV